MYSARFGFEYTILRYSNVYGPRQNPHGEAGVVAIFLNKILNREVSTINGDGVYLRDYIEVNDVVSANLASITTGVTGIHNVSTGVTLDVNQIWNAIVSSDPLSGYAPEVKNGPHREGDIRYSCCIPGEIPGWRPKISFEEGIKGTVSWFINNK